MPPLYQNGGWVGVSESEGENAAHAWFVRPSQPHARTPELQVIDAGWNDEHLTDIDQSGSRVLTTALNSGRITVRTIPTLDIVRELDMLEDELPLGACFVGSHLVTRLYHRQATIAIDSANRVHELEPTMVGSFPVPMIRGFQLREAVFEGGSSAGHDSGRRTATQVANDDTLRYTAALSEFRPAFLNGVQRSVNRKVQGSNPWSGASSSFCPVSGSRRPCSNSKPASHSSSKVPELDLFETSRLR
jgi:hypothetical protein